jgi:hypothetical protein
VCGRNAAERVFLKWLQMAWRHPLMGDTGFRDRVCGVAFFLAPRIFQRRKRRNPTFVGWGF